MFAGLVLMIPLILLHELAHALVAHLLGQRVFAIHLGAGNVTFTTRFLGMRWYLRQFLVSGMTIVAALLTFALWFEPSISGKINPRTERVLVV